MAVVPEELGRANEGQEEERRRGVVGLQSAFLMLLSSVLNKRAWRGR